MNNRLVNLSSWTLSVTPAALLLCVAALVPGETAETAQMPGFRFVDQAAMSDVRPLSLHSQLEAEGFKLPATKSAEEDPAGLWGFANGGFQASIRLRKGRFALGEQVIAWAIMRNITSTSLTYHISIPDLAWDVAVVTVDNRLLERRDAWAFKPEARKDEHAFQLRARRVVQGGYDRVLQPFQQMLHIFSLSDDYDLSTPGKYYVTLTRNIVEPGERVPISVATSTAMFEIVADAGNLPGTNALASPRTNEAASTARTLRPSNAPPPSAIGTPAGTDTAGGNATQNQTHAISNEPKANNAKPVEPGNEPASSPRRNLLWSGALAGLILVGAVGFRLLRRRES